MTEIVLDLQLFGDGAPAGGDGAGTSGDAGTDAAEYQPDTVLEDGTRVDKRLAAALNKQRQRRPDVQFSPVATGTPQQTDAQTQTDPEAEWSELKKGKYAAQYGRDVKAAIDQRFKNQADAQLELDKHKPMLDALCAKYGVQAGDYEALSRTVLDDDSLYEDEAEAHGMTVSAYKTFKALETEANQAREARARQEQENSVRQHLANLSQQAEEFKQTFPDFDLRAELANPDFRRLTAPNSGLNLQQAYFAIHHNELMPQAMAYGIQRGKQQVAQSIQANRNRPTEGAMQQQAAVTPSIDPRSMTRAQREELIRQARMGKKVVF